MVKLFFLCRRRADLTRDEYAARVLNGHVPLALKHHTTMRRYVVNIAGEDPDDAPAYDSLPSLCFDNLEDFHERLYDSPEGQAVIHADVQNFMGGSLAYATTEHVRRDELPESPLGSRTAGLKWVCLLARHPDLSHEEFVDHWMHVHGALALKHQPGIAKYVQNVVDARLSEDGDDWDGVAEVYYTSPRAVRDGRYDSPEGENAINNDIASFVGRWIAYPVAEYVQK